MRFAVSLTSNVLPSRTYLADNKTIVAVFRNHAPAGTLCITRSADEGHSWSPAKSLGSGDPSAMGGPASVEPKMALLDNGAVVISTGRVGLFLWISLTNGESWMPFNLVSCHDVAGIWVAFFQECQQSVADRRSSTTAGCLRSTSTARRLCAAPATASRARATPRWSTSAEMMC